MDPSASLDKLTRRSERSVAISRSKDEQPVSWAVYGSTRKSDSEVTAKGLLKLAGIPYARHVRCTFDEVRQQADEGPLTLDVDHSMVATG